MTQAIKPREKSLLLQIKEPNAAHYQFDSLLDLVDWLRQLDREKPEMKNWISHESRDSSFCKHSWSEALDQAEFGSVEVAEIFDEKIKALSSMMEVEVQRLVRDVAGELLDVGAFLSGEPEHFVRRAARPAPLGISITADMVFPWQVRESSIATRSVAMVALIDELQKMGMVPEVKVMSMVRWRKRDPQKITVGIKCDPVDVNVVAALSAPFFSRRFVFAINEHYFGENSPDGGGYGWGIPVEESDDPGFIFTGGYSDHWDEGHWKSLESARDHVLGRLEEWSRDPSRVVFV